ncbi:MAG: hypothetical protein CMM02_11140 [Rhodopirellula sp.]|nr:hypothetical protein [Rhodopirellula sp.]
MGELINYRGHITSKEALNFATKVVNDMIEKMSPNAINELMGGYSNDVDKLIQDLIFETFKTINTDGKQQIQNLEGLGNVSRELEETLRCESLAYFIMDVFGDDAILEWFHLDWCELAETRDKVVIIASRDHGKSYFWTHFYPIWQMYRYRKNHPKYKYAKDGFIFSHTDSKAVDFLEIIKNTIESNEILSNRLWDGRKEGWAKSSIRTKNGCTLKAKGFGSGVRGYHPSYIMVDDPLLEKVMYSPTQREKNIDYFYSVICNMLIPHGQLVVVGTPFHKQDLYNTFRKDGRNEEWAYREYPAIFPDGRILWEGRYDYKQLMIKRKTLGNMIFSREFLCRPVTSESSIFPYDTLKSAIRGMEKFTLIKNREASPKTFERIVAGCDFAISANVGSDYTVFTVWGVDTDNSLWLLNMFRKRGASFNEQIGMIRQIWMNYSPEVIVVEDNNFQSIYTQFLQDTEIPIKSHKTGKNKHDIKNGLPSLAVLFERGKIRLPYGDEYSKSCADVILGEFNNVTYLDSGGLASVSGHDDCVMSTWFARIAQMTASEGSFNFQFM